ncbi:MAG: hypothetical protein HQK51_20970 [Oligoflexia bacterium]|nr:hypothetical protein [Oligoflexia bacterium]
MKKKEFKNNPDINLECDFYNFCNSNNKLPVLSIIEERFLRSFRVSISNSIRTLVNLENDQSYIAKFKDWANSQDIKHVYAIIRMNPLESVAVIKLSKLLVMGIIDIMCGGSALRGKYDYSNMEYTSIELELIKEITDLIISDINEAWAFVEKIDAQHIRLEILSEFIGVVSPNELAHIKKYVVTFNSVSGEIELVYPYSTLFPIRGKLFSMIKKNSVPNVSS